MVTTTAQAIERLTTWAREIRDDASSIYPEVDLDGLQCDLDGIAAFLRSTQHGPQAAPDDIDYEHCAFCREILERDEDQICAACIEREIAESA